MLLLMRETRNIQRKRLDSSFNLFTGDLVCLGSLKETLGVFADDSNMTKRLNYFVFLVFMAALMKYNLCFGDIFGFVARWINMLILQHLYVWL